MSAAGEASPGMVSCGASGPGADWYGTTWPSGLGLAGATGLASEWHGKARSGGARFGTAGETWPGLARPDEAAPGGALRGRQDSAALGEATRGLAGKSRYGSAGCGVAWPDTARQARHRVSRPGLTVRGGAGLGAAGKASQGSAGVGRARTGQARRGQERHYMATFNNHSTRRH